MPVDPTLPTFIYPPDGTSGSPTLNFNYLDSVNVSWSGSNTESFIVQITLFILTSNVTNSYGISSRLEYPKTGSALYSMNIQDTYPAYGHFQMSYIYPNGTAVPGPNGDNFFVDQNSNLKPQTWSGNEETSPTISATAAGTTTSLGLVEATITGLAGKTASLASATGETTSFTSATTAIGTSQTTSNTSPSVSTSPSSTIGGGVIGGIVVAIVALLSILAAGFIFMKKRSKRLHKSDVQQDQTHDTGPVRVATSEEKKRYAELEAPQDPKELVAKVHPWELQAQQNLHNPES